jgi:hypothetical protein
MELEITRDSIVLSTENVIELAFLEDTLGLKSTEMSLRQLEMTQLDCK